VREEGKVGGKPSPHHFPGKEPGEMVISFQRRHRWALFKSLLLPVVLLVLCSAALTFLSPEIPLSALILASLFAFGLLLGWMGWLVLHWQNDHYIATDRRIIHLEKVPFFYERRHEVPLEKIQGVSIGVPNVLAKALRFGDLVIERTGGNIVFRSMPGAERMRRLVFGQISQLRARQRIADRERIQEELPAKLGHPLEEAPETSWEGSEGQATWRKHWITLVGHIFGPLALLALGFYVVLASGPSLPPLYLLAWRISLPAFILPLLLSAGWFWWQLEGWRNGLYIVTDHRLVDRKRTLLRREEIREVRLAAIQGVSYLIPHPPAWLLNYGHVVIETAGAGGRLSFKCISDPQRMQREIFRRMEAFQSRERQTEGEDRGAELADWFGAYQEIASQGGEID